MPTWSVSVLADRLVNARVREVSTTGGIVMTLPQSLVPVLSVGQAVELSILSATDAVAPDPASPDPALLLAMHGARVGTDNVLSFGGYLVAVPDDADLPEGPLVARLRRLDSEADAPRRPLTRTQTAERRC